MNIKGKTIVGMLVAIVIIMAFVIYFMFTYLDLDNQDMNDESLNGSHQAEHRLLS